MLSVLVSGEAGGVVDSVVYGEICGVYIWVCVCLFWETLIGSPK